MNDKNQASVQDIKNQDKIIEHRDATDGDVLIKFCFSCFWNPCDCHEFH